MFKPVLIAVAAVVFVAGGTVAISDAVTSAPSAAPIPASCKAPVVVNAEGGTANKLTIICKVPKVPGPTVIETATSTVTAVSTVTATATATQTVTASPSSSASTSPTPTPTPTPSSTPTPTTPPAGCVKPDASNTGATGTLTTYTGSTFITTPGTVIDGKVINGDLTIAAANVTVRNSRSTGIILIYPGGDGALISHVTGRSVTVSSAHRAVIEYSNLTNHAGGDTFHVTSDQGTYITGVTIRRNYVHDPVIAPGAHYDGLQVRGATDVLVECNNFDLGPYRPEYNAPVYIEGDNGGHSGVVVNDNWLFGGAFGFMFGNDNDGKTRLTNNRFGGDYKWGLCLAEGQKPAVQTGNTHNGQPVTPCT